MPQAEKPVAERHSLLSIGSAAKQLTASTAAISALGQQGITHELNISSMVEQLKASTAAISTLGKQGIAHELNIDSMMEQFEASITAVSALGQQDIANRLSIGSMVEQFKASTAAISALGKQGIAHEFNIGSMMEQFEASTTAISALGQQDIANRLSIGSMVEQFKVSTAAISALGKQGITHDLNIGSMMEQFKASTAAISALGQQDIANRVSIGSIMEQFNTLNAATIALESSAIPTALMDPEWFSVIRAASDLSGSHLALSASIDPHLGESHRAANDLALQGTDVCVQTIHSDAGGRQPTALDTTALVYLVESVVKAVLSSNNPEIKEIFWNRVYPLILFLFSLALAPVADHYIKLSLATLGSPAQQSNVKQVKSTVLQSGLPREMLRDHRYVDKNYGLAVRITARMNAQKIGILPRATVVQVLKTDGRWSLVSWTDEQGHSLIQGWVPTRYLKKFN